MLCVKPFAFVAVLNLMAICFAQSPTRVSGTLVQEVTFCQLAKNPAEFAGTPIRIRGIYRYALEENEFEPAECCPQQMRERFHARIDGNPMYPDAHSKRLARKLAKNMSATALVVFVGTLNGHLMEVEKVERIEKLSHPTDREHVPSWVPQNCEHGRVPSQ